MKYVKAIKIAIRAMKIQRRRHYPNAFAYHQGGAPGSRGEAEKWDEYDEAISLFEEFLEDERNPVRPMDPAEVPELITKTDDLPLFDF